MKNLLITLLLLPILSAAGQNTETTIETTELAPGIHRLFVNNAVAVVVFHGEDGVLVIDAAYERSAEKLMEEIRSISDAPIQYLINTHLHGDHTGGNKLIGKEADIIAHESVKEYLSTEQKRGETTLPPFPEYAQPNILVDGNMDLEFNGEKIQITHLEGGHTAGDLIVFFPVANVLVMGDLLFANYFPYVDVSNGGDPFRFLENVDRIIEHFPADATIVGGHGPVYTLDELRQWRENLSATITVMRKAKNDGMNLEEMKEKSILKEWESMGSFFITEDRWIDTLYPFL